MRLRMAPRAKAMIKSVSKLTYYALKPDVTVIAPWREWDLTSRSKLIEFAEKHQIPIAKDKRGEAPFSVDANLLHTSWKAKCWKTPRRTCPITSSTHGRSGTSARQTHRCHARFRAWGDPVAIDGKRLSPASLLKQLNDLGRANGMAVSIWSKTGSWEWSREA